MSLFERVEEFTLPEDNFGVLSLQGDLLDGDLTYNLDGLNFDLDQDGGFKPLQTQQASLESLVMPCSTEDSLGEDWMETVDLSSLLNGNQEVQPVIVAPPVIQVPAPEPEPRKEGLKPLAFELLKQLLTCPVADQAVEIPKQESLPSSPEQQVVDFQFLTAPLPGHSFDLLVDDEDVSSNCLEDLIEVKEIDNTVDDKDDVIECLSAPQSIQSNDSYSSEPSSPDSSFQTIDSSYLGDSSDSFSQVSENDFTDVKVSRRSKKESKRASPYKVDSPPLEKSVRKKVQNKNAATRYRVKKRMEKVGLQEQEGQLSDRNKELREKVESLQREILYMKELMAEIQKAKQKKI